MPPRFGGSAPKCPECGKSVYAAEEVKGPGGKSWHQLCFCCKQCGKSMRGGEWKEIGAEPHCHACHANAESVFGPRGCAAGRTSVVTEDATTASSTAPEALPAAVPAADLAEEPPAPTEVPQQGGADAAEAPADVDPAEEAGKPISLKERMKALQASHEKDNALSKDSAPTQAKAKAGGRFSATAPICPACSDRVYPAEEIKGPGGKSWHAMCFCCKACGKSMRGGQWREHAGEPHCQTCHGKLYGIKGIGYGNTLVDPGTVPVATANAPEATKNLASEESLPASNADAPEAAERVIPEESAPAADPDAATATATATEVSSEQPVPAAKAGAPEAMKEISEKSPPAAKVFSDAPEAVNLTEDSVTAVHADAAENTKPMSLKERAIAFQAAADASASKSLSFQPQKRSSAVKAGAATSEQQDKLTAEAKDAVNVAQTSEAQLCIDHAVTENGDETDRVKTESKTEAKTEPKAEPKAEPKTEPEQVATAAVPEQRDQDSAMTTEVAATAATETVKQGAAPTEVEVASRKDEALISDSSKDEVADARGKPQDEDQSAAAKSVSAEQSATVSEASPQLKPPQERQMPEKCTPKVAAEAPAAPEKSTPEAAPVCSPCTNTGPCSNYRLDVAGKNFGDCKCGFSKAAHETRQAKEDAPETVPSDSLPGETPASERGDKPAKPCSQYRLDVAGQNFGDCKCGFSKAAHEARQSEEENCVTAPSDPVPEESSAPESAEGPAAKPCSQYRLDVAGKSFGDCKCGFSKAAHEAQKAEEKDTAPVCSPCTMPEETSETATEPCSNYRLDVAGKNFGDCKCGFPKSAH